MEKQTLEQFTESTATIGRVIPGVPSMNPHFYVSPFFAGACDAMRVCHKARSGADQRGKTWLTRIVRQLSRIAKEES